jgi:hypothetical protein
VTRIAAPRRIPGHDPAGRGCTLAKQIVSDIAPFPHPGGLSGAVWAKRRASSGIPVRSVCGVALVNGLAGLAVPAWLVMLGCLGGQLVEQGGDVVVGEAVPDDAAVPARGHDAACPQ